jgi:hypothetical protein
MRRGRKNFAVRYNKNARQTRSLPCVFSRRTANNLFGVRFFFAVRYIKNARQTSSLPCARNKTHGKDFDARQTRVFPLCIRNQTAVLFSQNKPAPNIRHQPNEHAGSLEWLLVFTDFMRFSIL